MAKRKRALCQIEEITEDVILSNILLSLSMREAVKCSILSTRWRHLWTCIPNLNFDGYNMLNIPALGKKERDVLLKERANEFIKCVNKFLQHHRGVGIQTFKVDLPLHKKHTYHLDEWVSFAIAFGAKDLTLILYRPLSDLELYEFPYQLFACGRGSSIERICLVSCAFTVPPNFDGFKSLKSLHLTDVDVNERDIQDLLSSCSSLESLSVNMNLLLVNLKISLPSGQLKYLNVEYCPLLQNIEISAINLRTFEYVGHRVSFTYRNASRLTRIFLELWERTQEHPDPINYVLTELPHDLPQLETLFFNVFKFIEVGSLPINTNKFTNLKHLVMFVSQKSSQDLLWLASLMSTAPLLEKFELHI